MKRTNFLLLFVAGLAFTLAACSSRNRYGYGDYRGGYSYGYQQIRELADDLEDATDRVYDRAENHSYDSDREDYALDRLQHLHEEAKDFKDEVDDSRDPGGSRDDYRELVEAYYRAKDGMRAIRASGDVYREFDRVSRIMAQLNRLYGYGGRDSYGSRY